MISTSYNDPDLHSYRNMCGNYADCSTELIPQNGILKDVTWKSTATSGSLTAEDILQHHQVQEETSHFVVIFFNAVTSISQFTISVSCV